MLVTRVSSNQSNAAPLIGARAKNSQAASARQRSPGAARRRRQRQAHVPLPTSTNSPTRSTPGLSAQFLRTRHRRLRRGSSSHAAGFSGIRCASLANGATHTSVAAAAGQHNDGTRCRGDGGFDGFDVVVRRRGRRNGTELRERAAPRGSTPGADGHGCSLQLALRVAVGAQAVQTAAQEGNR